MKCTCGGACVLCDDEGMIQIIDEEYDLGVPGRACLECSSAWPASEREDHASWHHAAGCTMVVS
jgi:ferredoxin-like protein FixX